MSDTNPKKQEFISPEYPPGPLVVSEANPRYFTVASGSTIDRKAVYLTGSHIWNNFHDGLGPGTDCIEEPEQNDYGAYLTFLKDHGHNFIRLWRWEQFKSEAATASFHLCMTPQPWSRTGPGLATDGKPKFDLSRFDQSYFDRLRDRVIAAGKEFLMSNHWLEKVKEILESNLYMCLATVDGNQPWISPVYFSFDEHLTFYFVSEPTSDHARFLLANPEVALAVYDSRQPPYTGEGV